MGKSIIILDFFERKNTSDSKTNTDNASVLSTFNVDILIFENTQTKFQTIEIDETNNSLLVFC
jgi:hypothetical protein